MKRIPLAFCLFLAFICTAAGAGSATKPNPADFTLTVHVRISQFGETRGAATEQRLDVTIAGKRYRLSANAIDADVHGIGAIRPGLLPTGDYKARVMAQKPHTPDYLNFDAYELLLPDGRTLECRVSALYE